MPRKLCTGRADSKAQSAGASAAAAEAPAAAAAAGALAAGRAFGATLTAEQAAAWTVFSAAQEEHLTQKLKLQAVKLLQQHAEQAQSAANEKKVTMWLQAGLGVAGLTVVLLVGIKARREGP